MSLATAELGGEIVDCRGLDLYTREPPDHAAAKLAQARSQERAIKEPLRFLIVIRRPSVPNVVEMNSELGSVKRPPIAEILSGSDDFVPGFERHARSPISADGSALYWRRVSSL